MGEKKINLLIVDDDEKFLEATRKRLEIRGFNVIAANRGEKAVQAARENPVDIAVIDLKMPGMQGERTLEILKREHEWMEVVILTGQGSIESAVECTRIGAYSYLQKPCELDKLLEVMAEAYRKKVMNRLQIKAKAMDKMLKRSVSSAPLTVLRELREMDQEG